MERPVPRKKRRKRGARLALAYALRALLLLTALALGSLLICGVLYLREHLSAPPEPPSDSGPSAEDPEQPPPEPEAPSDEPQKAYVVVLDPGHGGADGGCSYNGADEKDITLAVALLTSEELRARGVTVVLTREADDKVSLEDRCQIANDAGADLFVSVHCNSYPEDTVVSGFEGYYHSDSQGQLLAQRILDAAGALGLKTRHVRDENYQVLRDTAMPAALMEIGFLTNPAECADLRSPAYQQTVAQAIADGILSMLSLPD